MCSASYQPAPSPSSTRPPLMASTWATEMASGPGSRKVAEVTRVPEPDAAGLPGDAGQGDPGVGGAGQPVDAPMARKWSLRKKASKPWASAVRATASSWS